MTRQLLREEPLKDRFTMWLTPEQVKFRDQLRINQPKINFGEFVRRALDRAIKEETDGKRR